MDILKDGILPKENDGISFAKASPKAEGLALPELLPTPFLTPFKTL